MLTTYPFGHFDWFHSLIDIYGCSAGYWEPGAMEVWQPGAKGVKVIKKHGRGRWTRLLGLGVTWRAGEWRSRVVLCEQRCEEKQHIHMLKYKTQDVYSLQSQVVAKLRNPADTKLTRGPTKYLSNRYVVTMSSTPWYTEKGIVSF